ncbi:type I polyketide synthase [Streptomyces uncialis]|nr:type I polyketide synthase [Streptomyces uncialis]
MVGEDKLREYLKRVTVELTDTRRRLAEAEARRDEPIAVIGMACRFPGADSVDAYWDLLRTGRSAVVDEVPDGRFDLDPWTEHGVYTRRGAFLSDITGWDARFFGFPPREALRMDPQQRLLMELAWEAMEDAGTPAPELAGSRTGVLVGFSDTLQYGRLEADRQGPGVYSDPYMGQGTSASVVAGRLAHRFDLRGPALALDTACSSSLVAVHLAGEALRRGECDLALAGGGFLAMQPDLYVHGCATSMLSRTGLCKTFDASADGYVLGEGGGLVVLARLSDAIKAGHRVRAVLRGSAVNQDGRSNGLTAPNRAAQVDVIRRALSAARTSPDQVAYVEAHGSGTPLGDGIELGALQDVFAAGEREQALHVGAVKTNIGHTQAAAGVAGLIKAVLVLERGVVPPNLNMTVPAEAVLACDTVRPAAGVTPLPDGDEPRIAGVSSFGWSGTNAHVVLEAAPAPEPAAPPRDGARARAHLLPVSAADGAALGAQLTRMAAGAEGVRVADVAFTLQTGRAAHEYRRAVVATSTTDAVARLAAAAGAPGVRGARKRPTVAFLLPDDGDTGRTRDAGRELYESEPEFAAAVDRCVALVAEMCGAALRPALFGGGVTDGTDEGTGNSAPDGAGDLVPLALFTTQYALARLLAHQGVTPDVLVGHGTGEYAAACLAGLLTLDGALRLVAARSGLLDGAATPSPDGATPAPQARETPGPTVVSAATGAVLTSAPTADPSHRPEPGDGPDRFAAVARTCAEHGVDICVELGTGPLGGAVRRTSGADRAPVVLSAPADGDGDGRARVLETAGRLWELGLPLDWTALRQGEGTLTGLPAYPYQRERFWIDPPATSEPVTAPAAPAADRTADTSVRLLTQRWTPAEPVSGPGGTGRFVLVADATGTADALATLLRADGADVLTLRGDSGTTDPAAVRGEGAVTVVDLTALDHTGPGDSGRAVHAVSRTLAGWGAAGGDDCRVVVVTRGGQGVDGAGSADPAQAAVAVLPVVANQEYLDLDSRCVDLDPAYPVDTAAAVLAAELRGPSDAMLVAHRGERRWTPAYVAADTGDMATGTGETATEAGDVPADAPAVRTGGTYLITGGLGDVGLVIAAHLVAQGAARVVLTSRRGLPDDPDDPRRAAVHRLRALGAEITTPRVDVTDAAAMRELFAGARVDGVLHAAADTGTDTFRPLRDLDEPTVARHFGAKTEGARVLAATIDELPADRAPDWCVLFSSTSALLGGVTFGGYAASNAALAAFGGHLSPGGTRWISAGWDTWACTLDKLDGGIGASLVTYSMSDAEALDALDRLVARRPTAVVVAVGDLDGRLPRPATGVTAPVSHAVIRHPRPELPQPYTPALGATERALAELWTDVLGIDPVGTRDNFFDLGGTSLLVPHLLGLVKKRFGVSLPTVTLFEAPTVRALGTAIDLARTSAAPVSSTPLPASAVAVPSAPVADAAEIPRAAVSTTEVPVSDTAAEASAGQRTPRTDPRPEPVPEEELDRRIAIVGMGGRFPGAADVGRFWRNLCDGVESITFFSPEEMAEAGVPAERLADPAYVAARPVLDDITGFDAAFFGMSPRMAALTDPQQRLFLEVCWEGLEHAGYARPDNRGRVGVFGGTHISTYLLGMKDRLGDDVSQFEIAIGNEKDSLTTNVSYLFDLHGPSVAVQTFCSTSLVAAHLAVQSLRSGECEMALAGGVSIRVPDRTGHLYTQGGMESPDGHVRTFDAKARGSMFGDGATVVVLKRLSDALRDGDHVWGVVRGSAMNNDGALKVGFTAPSVTGQARVIAAAMADAGVCAEDIGYVEAHGTGTPLGDPIEVAALTRAFGTTAERQYCPIGSVKTNVGHLDRAAGTAGLIKTSMVLRERLIPPTLHFTTPNPEIDFANSPFYVNTELKPWAAPTGRPRVAGLNSLGMGGTNVHMVVEEPPRRPGPGPDDPDTARRFQVLPLSARTATAADTAARRLGEHLRTVPDARLADVAFTLQEGRKVFEHRRAAVVPSVGAAVASLTGADDATPPSVRTDAAQGRPVAFLFTGVGEQYPGLVGELYRREPVFRTHLDSCLERLADEIPDVDALGLLTGARGGGDDLAALLGRATTTDPRAAELDRTEVAQPLLFAVEYALAATLTAWGVRPSMMLGYSLGEYVAATLSGVLSLDDALRLVAHRARLISTVEPGAMTVVPLPAGELESRFGLTGRGLDIAAVNGPGTVVVAGPTRTMAQLTDDLTRAGTAARPLRTTHAFHSRMLAPLAGELTDWIAANITLRPPTLPYVSNVTGAVADADLVTDPGYWARHMCATVRFTAGAEVLLADPGAAVVEIGPGQSLSALIRAAGCPPDRWPLITATLPGASDPRPADEVLTESLSRLWLTGVDIDWAAYHGRGTATEAPYDVAPGRIPLPTYPFERQRYWIDPATTAPPADTSAVPAEPTTFADLDRVPRQPEEKWLHLPVWRQSAPPPAATRQPASWLVYSTAGAADAVLAGLRAAAGSDGAALVVARPGTAFRAGPDGFTLRPGEVDDALALLRALRADGVALERVVHLWTLDDAPGGDPRTMALGLHSLVALARAACELSLDGWALDIVSAGTQQVLTGAEARPAAATVMGPALVIPLEYPTVTTRLIDVEPTTPAGRVVAELRRPRTEQTVALRGAHRWVCGYDTVVPEPLDAARTVLRERGVYLITGGLGGIALGLAGQLARERRARLVLLGRRGLPPRERWDAIASGAEPADDTTRDRVRRVLDIIALGAEVEIVTGDVADPGDVRRAVEVARARFGALHGVLHAAGVPGTGLMQFRRPEDAANVLAPKVAGSTAIAEALRFGHDDEVPLDFLVLFSSITSATGGGPGQVDYAAANAYLDAHAAQLSAPGRRVLAVDWGEWTWNAWDDGLGGYDDELRTFFRDHRATFGIGFEEGWRTLLRALATGGSRVVVSTQDLATMVRFSTGFTVDAVTAPAARGTTGERHPRPELVTPFQEPSPGSEERIAAIWCRALHLERVGAGDNFFELGGNSLLGISLLASLRAEFTGTELPPHILHEAPTVAALAKVVDAPNGTDPGPDTPAGRDSGAQGRLRRSAIKAAAARRRTS